MDDDSDILRGETFFCLFVFHWQVKDNGVNYNIYNMLLMVLCMLLCFSAQAFSCRYISFKIKGETAEEKVSPFLVHLIGYSVYFSASCNDP